MDDNIPDKDSAEYQWRKYFGPQRVEDFMWKSTSHGPEWKEKEIKEAVNYYVKSLKRIEQRAKASGRAGEFLRLVDPKKVPKKTLIEYIKKNI